MPVYIIATLDTKGHEAAFVRNRLAKQGIECRLVDAGCLGKPAVAAEVSRKEVFTAAGTSLHEMQQRNDRGEAVTRAAEGVRSLVVGHFQEGRVDGVLGLGGSAGTTIATAAMRALPLGLPKVMLSTLASGHTRPYVGGKDIVMLNSVVDIAGLNRISRVVLSEAAAAMAGMVTGRGQLPVETDDDRPLIAASMFGVTTPCVEGARTSLEQAGYEVLVFHATGNGGEAMEGLIADGLIAGVLDLTTTELADELVGGILSAGKDRLTAAGRCGVPQVISVGATDMVNFGPRSTVPERFRDRRFYQHNPSVTLMRTTVDESAAIGREIGEKAAAATGPTAVLLPLQGVSAIDKAGQPFDAPQARAALFRGVRERCGHVELIELDAHINDSAFASAAANKLLEMLRETSDGADVGVQHVD